PQQHPLLRRLAAIGFSQRALFAVARVARSLADMFGLADVDERCFALAIQLRRLPSFETSGSALASV
ncbi:MAG: hypothetical protein EBX02_04855, partial [Betaproteobacteria bacterium]|nr:hypothetical protein [Betaproteobacteria bacterium]